MAVGLMKVDYVTDPQGRWYGDWGTWYRLSHTVPPIPLLTVPDECPSEIAELALAIAAALWVDPGAAANRLRYTTEALLDKLRVAKLSSSRKRLTTHQRIERLRAQPRYAAIANTLEAVKWIGNHGSHAGGLTVSDVLEGAECLQHALNLLYDKSAERIDKRVKQINDKKGIPKRRRAAP